MKAGDGPAGRVNATGEGIDYVVCRLCSREFRFVNWNHLVGTHGWDPEDPVGAYRKRFPRTTHIARESRRAKRRALWAYNARIGRRWTGRRVLETLRRIARSGRRFTAHTVGHGLKTTAQRQFGSWLGALAAAGVPAPTSRVVWAFTRENIVQAIRDRARAGKSIRFGVVARERRGLLEAAKRTFGSWTAAVEVAGLSRLLPPVRRHRNGRELLEELRRLHRRDGVVSWKALKTAPRGVHVRLEWDLMRMFGTLPRALKAAGLPQRPRWLRWSPEKIVSFLRARARAGKPINAAALQHAGGGSVYAAAVARFGSWHAALRAADVDHLLPSRGELLAKAWSRRRHGPRRGN